MATAQKYTRAQNYTPKLTKKERRAMVDKMKNLQSEECRSHAAAAVALQRENKRLNNLVNNLQKENGNLHDFSKDCMTIAFEKGTLEAKKKIIKATIEKGLFTLTSSLLYTAEWNTREIFDDPRWFEQMTHMYCRGHFEGCPLRLLHFIFHDSVHVHFIRLLNPWGEDGTSSKQYVCYFALAKYKRSIGQKRLQTLLEVMFAKKSKAKTLFTARGCLKLLRGLELAIANRKCPIYRITLFMHYISTVDEENSQTEVWKKEILRVAMKTAVEKVRKSVVTAVLWQGQRWGMVIEKPEENIANDRAWSEGHERYIHEMVNILRDTLLLRLPNTIIYEIAHYV